MSKHWQILPPPPQSFFDQFPELPRAAASLLYHRGLRTQETIDEFLHPEYSEHVHDPFLFRDMNRAVARLNQAMKNGEKIVIYGDYDADGVSAAVILASLFRALGYDLFESYLPHRDTEGYGLNAPAIEKLAGGGAKVLITCDCGISNRAEVTLANKLGLDVIITDHPSIPAELPPAYAVIHPKVPGETYPDQTLSGGGVAFKLAQGILREHEKTHERLGRGERHEAFEKWLLDLVAISSVADMVPLTGESRTLTKYGLIVLNKTKRIGLQKLLLEAKLMDEETGAMKRVLDADTIGFHIAPRINAAGRMNHANVAYNLLITENPIEAINLAFELNQNNLERQRLTEEYVAEAREQLERAGKDSPVLFVHSARWPTGVVGLIAGRIKEIYSKPTIAMTQKGHELMGSGRSIDGFNMIAALQEMPGYFNKFGGHPMACGFTLASPEKLENFKSELNKLFAVKTKDLDTTQSLIVDAALALEDVDWDLYGTLDAFKPFGQANPRPRYVAERLKVIRLEPVGKQSRHLRFQLAGPSRKVRKAIGWNLCGGDGGTDWSKALKPGDFIDIVFEVDVNEWNGNRELQLTVADLRPSESV